MSNIKTTPNPCCGQIPIPIKVTPPCITPIPEDLDKDCCVNVNNTKHPQGYEDTTLVKQKVNNITAFREHLEFIQSPEEFSGFKNNVVLRLSKKILDSIGATASLAKKFTIKNVGAGKKVFKDVTIGADDIQEYNFRSFTSSDNSITIEQEENILDIKNNVSFEAPIKDITNIGTGLGVYKDTLQGIARLKSFKSNTIKITELSDTIYIDTISSGFNYLKQYYVNYNYSPTPESPADGSVIRPFPTFDEAIAKVVGTGTIANPENVDARIIVQTGSTTAINPSINSVTIELQNVGLTYTGTDLYMFDTEKIYPLIPKDSLNEITKSIYMNIVGTGTLTRTNGIGIIRSVGAKRNGSTTLNNQCYISIRVGEKDTDYITVTERNTYPDDTWEGDQLKPNGDKIGDQFNPIQALKWTTKLNPTTPLIMAKGNSFSTFSFSLLGAGRLDIHTLVNTGLWVEDTIVWWKKVHLNAQSNRIAVESGAVGVPGYATEIYQPKKFPAMYAKNGAFYTESLIHVNVGTFSHHGWDTFIKIEGTFRLSGMFNFDTNYYIETFIDATNSTDVYFQINGKTGNANLYSRIQYLLNTSIKGDFVLIMPNSIISGVRNITKNTGTNVIPETKGTLSSINGIPYISGIGTYANDAAAIANNLLKNAVYLTPAETMTTL